MITPQPSAARRAEGLAEFNQKAVRIVREGLACGMIDPVAVCVDLSTPMGQRIAAALFTPEEVAAVRELAAGGLEVGFSTGVWTCVERLTGSPRVVKAWSTSSK